MQRIFNKDGFNWWIGVVEDRMDPEKMGRCRVRIYGYHTDSKIILPTKDLPWATPIQPITSAAISGIGSSPLGPVEGTWVIGFFLDGEDMQQPAIFGTIATKAAKKAFAVQEDKPQISNPNDGILKDGSGNVVVDGQGEPVKVGTPTVEGWELGQTSEKFESGGKGPGTINAYNGGAGGDLGGASYGTYQLASFLPPVMSTGKARPSSKNSPVIQFLNTSKFKDKFTGLEPGTASFDAKWTEIAATFANDFKKEQHDYIQRKYYDVAIANLQRQGLNMIKYGPAVQDLIWSGAVQFGPANTKAFTEALRDKSTLTDKDIVTLVSEYKINNVDTLFKSSSESIRAGVKSRYQSEKQALLKLIT
jgi:type VI secretion system secreted protein VgrG